MKGLAELREGLSLQQKTCNGEGRREGESCLLGQDRGPECPEKTRR